MEITITAENVAILVGTLGPILVGAVTGLKTSSKIKAWLSVAIVTLFSVLQSYTTGWESNVIQNVITTAVVWAGVYNTLLKGTGIADFLQKNVPVYIGQPDSVDSIESGLSVDEEPIPTLDDYNE